MDTVSVTLSLAYALDLSVGDPRWLPHPVRGLGWIIQRGENLLRSWIKNEGLAGWLLALGIPLGAFGLVLGLTLLAQQVTAWLAALVEVALLFFCLSTRDLAVESWPVYHALQSGDLKKAQANVAMIVGRDTDALPEPDLVRATVETVAESAMDGIIAPLFYAALGGAPWAFLYKAVNTMDSMVGFRSSRYLRFGRAAARLDTWMNVVPARVTALVIALGALPCGLSGRGALRIFARDGLRYQENSFLPEAAMAGALKVQLGGVNFYQGKAVETPRLGDPVKPLTPSVIPQAIRLMYLTSLLGLGLALSARWAIFKWIR